VGQSPYRRNPFVNQVSFFSRCKDTLKTKGEKRRNPFVNQVSFFEDLPVFKGVIHEVVAIPS